ncbi:YTH domain-containing protein 1 [Amphibalanus amphitrite]|uniref:YTH domain-containing protein 1 n=1 Tax=Amphibalanus amphitrite TaxID=1232801 RepID=A0A6A4XAX4_AMPAM|nr:YTH domain-containing protein 1 [Amphibalanus amphitrite]
MEVDAAADPVSEETGGEPPAATAAPAADDNYDTRSEVSSGSSKSLHSELSVDVDEDGSEPSTAAAAGATSGSRESYLTKLNYLFRDARFFIIKSNNEENVTLAKARGVWSTPPQNEAKLNQAFRESRNVLLIFSVKESGRFCGFCRISNESRRDLSPVNWVLPPGLPARALGGVFRVAWINRNELPFPKTAHLYNPWNNGKPVKIGRDGQEVEPRVAEELCRRFARDLTIDMNPILLDSKRASRTVKTSKPLTMPAPIPVRRARRDFRERGGFRGRGGPRAPPREPPRLPSRRPRYEDHYPRPPPRRDSGPPRYHPYARERPPPHERSPVRYPPREPVPRIYPELMRELAARGGPLPPLPYPPPALFDPLAPPRYYDGPPLPEFVPPPPAAPSRAERRMSEYDRSVEEFLRHTSSRRERSRERRHRDRR